MGKEIAVRFDIGLPENATDEEVDEWLKFELIGGGISKDNPLSQHDVVADYPSLRWEECQPS